MGFLVVFIVLNIMSREMLADRLGYSSLQTACILFGIPSPEDRFASLKWSSARHGLVALISAALIFYVFPESKSVCGFILWINILYSYLPLKRYLFRKKMLNEAYGEMELSSSTAKSEIQKLMSSSLPGLFYCVFLLLALFIVYYFRP